MKKEELLARLTIERNNFAKDCERRIAVEDGKIMGADYICQRLLEIINAEETEAKE